MADLHDSYNTYLNLDENFNYNDLEIIGLPDYNGIVVSSFRSRHNLGLELGYHGEATKITTNSFPTITKRRNIIFKENQVNYGIIPMSTTYLLNTWVMLALPS